jgi:hypothetical protein
MKTIDPSGDEFVLEAADAFDREVAELSRNERFMAFLAGRAEQPGTISLEEIDRRLSQAEEAISDRSAGESRDHAVGLSVRPGDSGGSR